jgi:hypothetical protein
MKIMVLAGGELPLEAVVNFIIMLVGWKKVRGFLFPFPPTQESLVIQAFAER